MTTIEMPLTKLTVQDLVEHAFSPDRYDMSDPGVVQIVKCCFREVTTNSISSGIHHASLSIGNGNATIYCEVAAQLQHVFAAINGGTYDGREITFRAFPEAIVCFLAESIRSIEVDMPYLGINEEKIHLMDSAFASAFLSGFMASFDENMESAGCKSCL